MYSKIAREVLFRSGWRADRKIDISSHRSRLERGGYRLFPLAEQFLENAGGIEGEFHSLRFKRMVDFYFDASRACSEVSKLRIDEDYVNRPGVKGPMIPIGAAHSRHMALLLSRSGAMYGGVDSHFWLYGRTLEEGVNTLLEGREPVEVSGSKI